MGRVARANADPKNSGAVSELNQETMRNFVGNSAGDRDNYLFRASDDFVTSDSVDATNRVVFRNGFLAPSRWRTIPAVVELATHRYLSYQGTAAIQFISERLETVGFEQCNKIGHDFFLWSICDLLTRYDFIFITADEIDKSSPLFQLVRCKPDIIVRRTEMKPLLIDIQVGNTDISEIEFKYEAVSVMFDFVIVTELNFFGALRSLLPTSELSRLYQNFQALCVEHQYWLASIKLQRIIGSPADEAEFAEVKTPDGFAARKVEFVAKLNARASQLLTYDY